RRPAGGVRLRDAGDPPGPRGTSDRLRALAASLRAARRIGRRHAAAVHVPAAPGGGEPGHAVRRGDPGEQRAPRRAEPGGVGAAAGGRHGRRELAARWGTTRNRTEATTGGRNGAWSTATNSARSTWTPGARVAVVRSPNVIAISPPST